jgi:hypothetical protein
MSKTRVAKINASAESVRRKSATEVAFAELSRWLRLCVP